MGEESNQSETRVLGEVERLVLLLCQAKVGHSRLLPWKTVFQPRRIWWRLLWWWFKDGVSNKIRVWVGLCCFQSLSHVQLFVTPWTAACQASLSFTVSWSLLKLMSIESMMPSNHLLQCHLFCFCFSLSQHQGLFLWVSSSHQVAKVWSFPGLAGPWSHLRRSGLLILMNLSGPFNRAPGGFLAGPPWSATVESALWNSGKVLRAGVYKKTRNRGQKGLGAWGPTRLRSASVQCQWHL